MQRGYLMFCAWHIDGNELCEIVFLKNREYAGLQGVIVRNNVAYV
jgi:hypothetical protein